MRVPRNESVSSTTKVLLIDDDAALLARTKDYLQAKGHQVTTTSNIFEVPSIVGARRPDLVVLDIRMPALSGSGVASTLQRLYAVPIVFYSAVDDEEGHALASQYPGAVFVSKAQGIKRLNEEIARALARPGRSGSA